MNATNNKHRFARIVIGCGGTGGHLFPGLAVAEQLRQRGCAVTLVISPKEVDQQAIRNVSGMEIITLPAVGLTRRRFLAFLRGFTKSYRVACKIFQTQPPDAALAMGGFASAPPLLAAKRLGARTFLHESNAIPGRANRWLSRVVDRAFVGFGCAAPRLRTRSVTITGTPVRPQFRPRAAAACRTALGLDPVRPVVLVMGGSQGAGGINEMITQSLPLLAREAPDWQWFHLTGPADVDKVRQAYVAAGVKAEVQPFFGEMELALGAASAAVSRAGASSLAELAVMQVPALLVPYPAAVDNHQYYNARLFEEAGAALLVEQKAATPELVTQTLRALVEDTTERESAQKALRRWHVPKAAEQIVEAILAVLDTGTRGSSKRRRRSSANPFSEAATLQPGSVA